MTEDIEARVIAILAEQAVMDPGEITPNMTLEQLKLDSLGMVEAIFAFEENFDISIPFNASEPEKSAFDTSSVGAVIAAVRDLVRDKA
ncbi:MAG: phosphopantetheine-binding protein [Rhodobacterales bacterium]|nr:MAG: phosphopantetheine-binding protein [Rhodobacterales bacterium]